MTALAVIGFRVVFGLAGGYFLQRSKDNGSKIVMVLATGWRFPGYLDRECQFALSLSVWWSEKL